MGRSKRAVGVALAGTSGGGGERKGSLIRDFYQNFQNSRLRVDPSHRGGMTEQLNSQPADSSVNLNPLARYGQKVVHHAVEAQDIIMNYRPTQTARTEWAAIRPFVVDVAQDVPFINGLQTRLLLRALTRLAKWANNTAMLPLDADILLDPHTIAEACHSYESHNVARDHQWVLLRAAEERGQEFSPRTLKDRHRPAHPRTRSPTRNSPTPPPASHRSPNLETFERRTWRWRFQAVLG